MRFPLSEPERAFDFADLVDFAELFAVLADDSANKEPDQNKLKDNNIAAHLAVVFMDRIENTIRESSLCKMLDQLSRRSNAFRAGT
jgi:hypothetical protein